MTKDGMGDLDYIAEPLRKHAVSVDSVSLDPANVREHPEKNKEAVKSSLREFGQRQVLVAREEQRTIEAGNLRLTCARELGWSHVAVIFVDDDDLEAARYAIADNRASDLADWDDEGLGELLDTIDDPPPGYTDEDVGALIDTLDQYDQDQVEEEALAAEGSLDRYIEGDAEFRQLMLLCMPDEYEWVIGVLTDMIEQYDFIESNYDAVAYLVEKWESGEVQ